MLRLTSFNDDDYAISGWIFPRTADDAETYIHIGLGVGLFTAEKMMGMGRQTIPKAQTPNGQPAAYQVAVNVKIKCNEATRLCTVRESWQNSYVFDMVVPVSANNDKVMKSINATKMKGVVTCD